MTGETNPSAAATNDSRSRLRRHPFVILGLFATAATAFIVMFVVAWGRGTAHEERSTGIFERDGVPVIVHARCGSLTPLESVEVRVLPSDGGPPTDDDEVVFRATAVGDGLSEVPLASEVEGYTVERFRPLRAGDRYYATKTRYISSSGEHAPSFTVSDLDERTVLVLYPLPQSDRERAVPRDEWLESTSC